MISPIFEKLSESEEFAGAKFYKVDVDEASVCSQLIPLAMSERRPVSNSFL